MVSRPMHDKKCIPTKYARQPRTANWWIDSAWQRGILMYGDKRLQLLLDWLFADLPGHVWVVTGLYVIVL